MKAIAEHYIKNLITSPLYNSPDPIRDTTLLFTPFFDKLTLSINMFNVQYPDVKVVFVETYRSNILQLQHYNNHASKIKRNGMHHYGIAADLAFKINGQFTYKGNYDFLRSCHERAGLHLLGAWDIGHVQGIDVNGQIMLRYNVEQAVKEFQREHGLTVDGIVGKITIAKAKEVVELLGNKIKIYRKT